MPKLPSRFYQYGQRSTLQIFFPGNYTQFIKNILSQQTRFCLIPTEDKEEPSKSQAKASLSTPSNLLKSKNFQANLHSSDLSKIFEPEKTDFLSRRH
ncbi:hypothetical protein QBE54_00940 [Thermatribacter velox]|jgi:hypothetical protein|uniref:Uncharacterized protein n=1 Tax=Thermatribacter velox TaxID=3039681 RepID=A0ABZ2YF65_9BACT